MKKDPLGVVERAFSCLLKGGVVICSPRRRRGNLFFCFLLPPGGVTFVSSGGVQRSVQRERACAPSPFGNSLPVGWAIIKSRPSRRSCGGWGRCGALRRENSIYSSLPVTAVEGKTPAVATGSVSEATAESCGGTVLLTDNGTRENRLREKREASLRQGVAR